MNNDFDIYQGCKVNKCTEEGVKPNLRQLKGVKKVKVLQKYSIDQKSRNRTCFFPLSMDNYQVQTIGFADFLIICNQSRREIVCIVELKKTIKPSSDSFKRDIKDKFSNTLRGLNDDGKI